MTATVLFIDDDHRLVEKYAKAAEGRGLRALRTFGVDEALRLVRSGVAADAVVWDMMLVPGEAFEDEETESGLSTGRFLYPELRRLLPDALYVLLTNDATSVDLYERSAERSFGRAKRDTSATDLAAFLASHLRVARRSTPTDRPPEGPRAPAERPKRARKTTTAAAKPSAKRPAKRAQRSVTTGRARRAGKG